MAEYLHGRTGTGRCSRCRLESVDVLMRPAGRSISGMGRVSGAFGRRRRWGYDGTRLSWPWSAAVDAVEEVVVELEVAGI